MRWKTAPYNPTSFKHFIVKGLPMSLNQERIDKLTAQRDRLQQLLDDNADMGLPVDISKGNEHIKMVSAEKVEEMIRKKEMQIMRAGGTL